MPFLQRDGVRIHWRADGSPDLPALILGNSLGTDQSLWDCIMPLLTRHYRVIRMDMRGHGASALEPAKAPQAYSIEQLARDTLAVADAAGVDRFHYAGISIGGMIGMWLGAHAPMRLHALVLSNTAAKTASDVWAERIAAVRSGGMAALVDSTLERWFTPAYRARGGKTLAAIRRAFLNTDPVSYIGCALAIRDMDLRGILPCIEVPTVVLTGSADRATPPTLGEEIAALIPRARCIELPVAHIPHPELPQRFVEELMQALPVTKPAR